MKGFRDLEGTVLVQSSAFPPVLCFHDRRDSPQFPLTILVKNILAGVRGAAMSPPKWSVREDDGGEINFLEGLERGQKRILEGGLRGWGTIYLDIRETISIEFNCRFRLLVASLNEVFFVFFCQKCFGV